MFLNYPHVRYPIASDSFCAYGVPRPAVLYGLAVHFKIYPIYFVLAMLLYLDDSYDAGGGADRGLRYVWSACGGNSCRQVIAKYSHSLFIYKHKRDDMFSSRLSTNAT